MIYNLGETKKLHLEGKDHFIADSASIIGNVFIGSETSIWFNAVIRGDVDDIKIGNRSNIQDGSVLHVDPGTPLIIGDDVTIGHKALLHGCCIGNGTLVGMNSVILNHAQIGENCLIGANTLITERKNIPPRSLIIGSPGKVIRELTEEEIKNIHFNSMHYVQNAKYFLKELRLQTQYRDPVKL